MLSVCSGWGGGGERGGGCIQRHMINSSSIIINADKQWNTQEWQRTPLMLKGLDDVIYRGHDAQLAFIFQKQFIAEWLALIADP